MKKEIKYILFMFIILLALFSFQLLFHNKDYNDTLPEVKLKEKIEKEKAFAIMLSKDGSNYQKYESDEWPDDKYKFKEAKCVDNKGNLVDNAVGFDNKTKTVILETDKTLSCTLYFDHKETIEILRDNDNNNVLSTDIVGGMYRYQGVGNKEQEDETHKIVDNNYICFGTDKKEECINNKDKYMYRIIGITKEGQLYLIKMKGIEEGEDKRFQWNSKYDLTECEGETCEWPNVDIYKRLNGETSNGNPVFINNPRYEYMQEENDWYKKIEKHNWLYGDVANGLEKTTLDGEIIYGSTNNGLIIYDIETGVKPTRTYDYQQQKYVKHQWSAEKSIDAKIGLMYLHDYYLAYDNERNWRLNYDTNNWIFVDNNNNTASVSYEWTISRVGYQNEGNGTAWSIHLNGQVVSNGFGTRPIVRPTFYLTTDNKIKNGIGIIDDPFILDVI